jgi:hypothetical protein
MLGGIPIETGYYGRALLNDSWFGKLGLLDGPGNGGEAVGIADDEGLGNL